MSMGILWTVNLLCGRKYHNPTPYPQFLSQHLPLPISGQDEEFLTMENSENLGDNEWMA